jgi:hypothetical protein
MGMHHSCRFDKYGGLFTTYVLFNPMVVVTDETEVRRLLQVGLFDCFSMHLRLCAQC